MVSSGLIVGCGVGPAVLVGMLAVLQPVLLPTLDTTVYDALVQAAPFRPASDRIVIVDVDERSLVAIGQWPWPRDRVALLVTALRERGASIVGLDIIFAEADRTGRDRRSPGDTAPDVAFARTLKRGGVILGHAFVFDDGPPTSRSCELHPLNVVVVHEPGTEHVMPFFQATGAVCNLAALSTAAGASGFLNAAPDPDGVLRRAPLLLEFNGRVFPGLALAAVMAVTDLRVAGVRVSSDQSAELLLTGGRAIPVDGKGNLLLRYRGKKRTFRYVSALDVLKGSTPPGAFRDKIVLVGTTALGTREVVATPLDTLFAGVEVQATIADNLLQGDFFRRHEFAPLLECLLVLAGGGSAAFLMARTGLLTASLFSAGFLGALWLGAAGLLSTRGVFLSPLLPSLGCLASVTVMTWTKASLERRRADREGDRTATAQNFMVQSLLSLVESRHGETGRHSRRTQQLTRLLAQELSTYPAFRSYLTPERVEMLSSLAPLHDIGKVSMPDRILNKPGRFNDEEFAEMRLHPAHGRDVILRAESQVGVSDDAILTLAKEIVYTHHERWDGTGYPEGLRGTEIPVAGRIMTVVDVYDATVNRKNPYNPSLSHEEAAALIAAGRGTQFDPDVVEAFLSVSGAFKKASQENR